MSKVSVFPELKTIKFDNTKPIIVCDADEVIFNFMEQFVVFLKKEELYFSWKSYSLSGNILDKKGFPVSNIEIQILLKTFFSGYTDNMKLISGVKKGLATLSNLYNIIVLSNIPFEYYSLRKEALEKNKLDFPFIANRGGKGKTCDLIFKMFGQKTWFIDDSPHQVFSVKKHAPGVKTILYVQNKKLAKLIDHEKCWDYYSNNWKENLEILGRFN